MGRPEQAWKRDNFGWFQRHTRAERRANVTSSNSSDDSTSYSHGRTRCGVVKIEANSGSSTSSGNDSSSDSGVVYEVCECGKRKVEGHPCRCMSFSKRMRVLIDLDSDDDFVHQDNLDEKLDALVAKVVGFTSANIQRRISLAGQLELVNKKLDALIVMVDGLTARNT
ncbi:hypothetical protein GUJ93_ZPchr0005g15001 [Zizania palustris]|uniref:Uncharacterized protein n=1 Tax=Zizania palustris TaxID=103762 RepID=A0A8J5SHJ0_ZIZPA|nr:hypothetical protein GUJ93_ZPchr0005g15001 [Zizania palustris]